MPSSAVEWIPIVPILALSGQFAGPSAPKFAWASVQAVWPSAASGLIVSPGGSVTTAEWSSEGVGCKAEGLWVAELDVQSRCGVGLFGCRAGEEDRFEGYFFATGHRWVGVVRLRRM